MDQAKAPLLLQSQEVLGAHRVRAPQLLVKVLAVPASKLGGQVIHHLERPHLVEDAGNLADVAHVART